MKKIMLCLLTSHDLGRLHRLILSVEELKKVSSIELFPVIVVNTLDDSYYTKILGQRFTYPVIRTESNGKPGKGKNSCFDIFLNSDCDYLTQFDGDDILYPTYLQSIENHLKHYPNLDVLGIIPIDIINYGEQLGHKIDLGNNIYAGVWGISLIYPYEKQIPGPCRDNVLWDYSLARSWDYIILQSKKASLIKMDEDIAIGEDHLWSIKMLSEHQKGNIQYYNTMSSDMFIIDRTTDSSVQKTYSQADYINDFKSKARGMVTEERSSYLEIPIIYKQLLLSQTQKEKWVKNFWKKTEFLLSKNSS